jgi:hypothetical protein
MAWLAKQGSIGQMWAEKLKHVPSERREQIGQAALFIFAGSINDEQIPLLHTAGSGYPSF